MVVAACLLCIWLVEFPDLLDFWCGRAAKIDDDKVVH